MTDERGEPRLYTTAKQGIRVSVGLLAGRALVLAGAALVVGDLVDQARGGGVARGSLILMTALLVTAALLGGWWPKRVDRLSSAVAADLRSRVLRRVISNPRDRYRSGEIASLATEGVGAVGALAGLFIPQLIGGILIPLLLCAVVAFVDVPTALILLITVPAVPLLLRGMEKRFESVTARYRSTADRLTSVFYDGIQGMSTLRGLNASDPYRGRLSSDSEQLRGETMALLRVNQLALLAVDSLFTVGTVVAAGAAAAWRFRSGAITAGEAVALVLLGVALIEPLSQIGRFFYVGAFGRAAANEIKAFLVPPPAGAVRQGSGGLVELSDVTVRYGSQAALEGFSLRVEPGESVGIVGPSGAGKSTVAGVITGLTAVDSGSVRVNGRVALVSQHPFLFHGSVRDNLSLADPGASDDAMWSALEAVGLDALVESRGQGLDLQVGERGVHLSGGESQRLTIARMILADAPIVVLDEPTSNVDVNTERLLGDALARLTKNRTVGVITHRRSMLADLDRVVILRDGSAASDELTDVLV